MKRIGIFAGTFDPIHKGHIAFALKAAESAELDKVYFLPEQRPRNKSGVTHVSHRLAMLKLAARSHGKLEVLDLPDKQFNITQTWPRLRQQFPNDTLLLMMGGDVFGGLAEWPHVDLLFEDAGVIVSTKGERDIAHTLRQVVDLDKPLWEVHLVESDHPEVSSRIIRSAIASTSNPDMLLASVQRYIDENWLYIDIRTFVSR